MRILTASIGALLVGAGCASVVGLDFDTYHEGVRVVDGGGGLQCVPNSTVRCLCELEEGIQTCSESGRLSPCQCRDGGSEAGAGGAACGNGLLETGEACDDGNTIAGDGCSNTCVPDGRPAAVEACPGQPFTVWAGLSVRMDLATFVRGGGGDGGTCGFLAQPDRVYTLNPTYSGPLPIVVTSDAALSFSVRSTCATAATALSCDAVVPGTPVSRTVNVEAGKPLFLVIEPAKPSATATYSIQVGGT